MNLSHAYDEPPPFEQAQHLLLRALDLGVTHFDTAALYGFGVNEELVGKVLKSSRSKIVLATKGGMYGIDGKRVIDGRPETIKSQVELSLRRLQTDVVDLFYLHRWDKRVPIEDSVGAMADLVRAGKVKALGLSEVSASTLRRAHAVHPIAAVQSEYSLWTRNAEIAVLETCREIGATLVAFSPLARGWLTNQLRDVTQLVAKDIRKNMPRFQAENFTQNLPLLDAYAELAREHRCTPAQLALAWLLAKHSHVLPIPGTRVIEHLEENLGAANVSLDTKAVSQLDTLFAVGRVAGPRYPAAAQVEIDTEEFQPA
jgi:aryl-alcohol dehydrogenase-like predicted oxidoreductase